MGTSKPQAAAATQDHPPPSEWSSSLSTFSVYIAGPGPGPGPSSCPQVQCPHPAWSWTLVDIAGPGPASESDVIILQSSPPYFRVTDYHTSSYFRVTSFLHPDHSPHINHISETFSTQIITFPGFISSKNTVSVFLLQERSPKPAENSVFHICQKITYFDIFHLFCHFLRSAKITHFHKNTKITYFHYFPLWW